MKLSRSLYCQLRKQYFSGFCPISLHIVTLVTWQTSWTSEVVDKSKGRLELSSEATWLEYLDLGCWSYQFI